MSGTIHVALYGVYPMDYALIYLSGNTEYWRINPENTGWRRVLVYRQTSNVRGSKSLKFKRFSSRFVVVFAQSIEDMC